MNNRKSDIWFVLSYGIHEHMYETTYLVSVIVPEIS